MKTSTILIASAGRRNYLVRWFREALADSPAGGKVIAADFDPYAPARMEADAFARLPAIDDPTYTSTLLSVCSEHNVDLALSLNDYELSTWAHNRHLDGPTLFLRLTPHMQSIVEDKLTLSQHLGQFGVTVPFTTTAREVLANPQIFANAERVVIKNRFGSGSAGLRFARGDEVTNIIASVLPLARNRTGSLLTTQSDAADAIVVQPYIDGHEYGIDVVNNLDRKHAGTLARRKLSMRGGETDSALSVDSAPFDALARGISKALSHRGPVDIDVLVDDQGSMSVIDINPRFGGGYPFSHLAGANIPRALTSWLQGGTGESFLRYDLSIRGAKHVGLTRVYADELS